MNNHILIRNALLGSWNVGSEYIRLCGNEKFETPDELSSRFNINVKRGSLWHFFRSADTQKIGPSAPLKKLLEDYGIKVVIYE